MKNRGQALIEFILILPVFLFLVLGMIDLGKIIYTKFTLQNDLNSIVELYKDDLQDDYYNYANNKKISLNITTNNNLTTIKVSKNIEISTPILSNVLKSPYLVEESMTVYEK